MSFLVKLNRRRWPLAMILAIGLCSALVATPALAAEEDLEEQAKAAAGEFDDSDQQAKRTSASSGATEEQSEPKVLNLWELTKSGGWLMLPIVAMSFLVVFISIERSLALRRSRVIPNALVDSLGQAAANQGGFDPRRVYRLCQEHASAASRVIRAMLLKVGRPHSEVEHAVSEASEREAERLFKNARYLSLAAGVTPLLGLLGTVWGMIQAFFATANMPASSPNKAHILADGIYVALVTTLFGLAVAIVAALLAHLFEARIQSLFHEIDELLFNLLPQVERFEGKLRVNRELLGEESTAAQRPKHSANAPPVQAELVGSAAAKKTAPPPPSAKTPK